MPQHAKSTDPTPAPTGEPAPAAAATPAPAAPAAEEGPVSYIVDGVRVDPYGRPVDEQGRPIESGEQGAGGPERPTPAPSP
jgi:hypothetical protein